MVVDLFYARRTDHGEPNIHGDVFIEVENIAYHKKVWVQERGYFQHKKEACYLFKLDDKREVWHGRGSDYLKASDRLAFDIECEVNEHLYRDGTFSLGSNLSRPYYKKQGGIILLGSVRVLLDDAKLQGNKFFGTIFVRNISYQKQVKVVYSMDNWKNMNQVDASFQCSFRGQHEIWHFSTPVELNTDHVEFAIAYSVDGDIYWDNNLYRNYCRQREKI